MLTHLSSKVVRYERASAAKASNKAQTNKGTYYKKVVKIFTQQASDTKDFSNEEEMCQVEVHMAKCINSQAFECPTLKKPKQKKERLKEATK